jgi:hypothetical protein
MDSFPTAGGVQRRVDHAPGNPRDGLHEPGSPSSDGTPAPPRCRRAIIPQTSHRADDSPLTGNVWLRRDSWSITDRQADETKVSYPVATDPMYVAGRKRVVNRRVGAGSCARSRSQNFVGRRRWRMTARACEELGRAAPPDVAAPTVRGGHAPRRSDSRVAVCPRIRPVIESPGVGRRGTALASDDRISGRSAIHRRAALEEERG